MSAILSRRDQAISISEMAKSPKAIVDSLASGEQDHYVIMRNNAPAAVVLSVDEYEALLNELTDLRVEAIAAERLMKNTPKSELLSHEEIFADYK